MDIYRLIKVLIRNSIYIIGVPIIAGVAMLLLTNDMTHEYSSKASVFSGVTSNTSLDNLGSNNVDFFANKTTYNNLLSIINSQKVMRETSLRLLTQHLMLDEPVDTIISKESYRKLHEMLPDEVIKLVDKNSFENTYQNLSDYIAHDKENFVYGLLNYDIPFYSYNALSKIEARQDGSSDIIQILYKSEDPGITYQTIKILIHVFLREYAGLKRNQSDAVVEYFQNQLNLTSLKLAQSEDQLLKFNTTNKIINFYEQTKHISSQQEKIEVKLQEILMEYEASRAVFKKLEDETKTRYNVNLTNKEILNIRNSLVDVNQEIAELEIEENDSLLSSDEGKKIINQKKNLENSLKDKINALYVYNHNTEGVEIKDLLNNWLQAVIEYEGISAQLKAMQQRKEEFDHLYSQFVPLGAELKRIERKINVTEDEYLDILHHLGLVKLKQQSQELMANMKILDEPYFPIDPQPTKRKIYIIIVSFFSMIFVIMGIVVFELLDKTIKNKENLLKHSGLKTLGIVSAAKRNSKVDYNLLNTTGIKPVVEKVLALQNTFPEQKNVLIQFVSHWQGEGKTHIIKLLQKELERLGYTVNYLSFDPETELKELTQVVSIKEVLQAKKYSDLVSGQSADFILTEVPALSDKIFNQSLMGTANYSFVVSNAQRTWSDADNFINEKAKMNIGSDYMCILNKAAIHNMENMLGEIPKKRSAIRRFVKHKILKRFI